MKRFISLFLSIVLCLSLPIAAFADVANDPADQTVLTESIEGEPTRAEETCWYFRVWNGRTQMRLWSITYRKWLTEWIDIGPA